MEIPWKRRIEDPEKSKSFFRSSGTMRCSADVGGEGNAADDADKKKILVYAIDF